MKPSLLPYDQWIRDSLRGVMRNAVQYASENGLPDDHHFYITFDTTFDGVCLPPDLRGRYPEEMTIVLQHQFWDLIVDDEGFGVTLKFFGTPRDLRVPFAAVTGFVDPAINFAIQLQTVFEGESDGDEEGSLSTMSSAPVVPGIVSNPQADDDAEGNLSKGDVITLDSFRKNKT
jgi:hypothetical protein